MNKGCDKNLIGVVPFGGLGNQLFQYSAALTFALRENTTVELVLIGDTRNRSNGEPEILEFPIARTSHINSKVIPFPNIVRRLSLLLLKASNYESKGMPSRYMRKSILVSFELALKLFTNRKFVYPTGLGWDAKLTLPKGNFTLLGNFHSFAWVSHEARAKMRSMLHLENIEELNYFRELAILEKPTAIHIRLGDYLEISELNVITKEYFARSLRYLQEKSRTENFWIFTNDEDSFRDYLPTEVLENIRVIPQHLSACETLEVMRMCDNYIISNSTFSWWGAFLSHNQEPIVVAPKNWFSKHPEPFRICPDDWVRL
jgi:hypothetical protein